MVSMPVAVKILPSGDAALTVEFGDTVDAKLNAQVLALDAQLAANPIVGIDETVPTYRSLLVFYNPSIIEFAALRAQLLARPAGPDEGSAPGATWSIPVVYGGPFGIDLEALSQRHGLTPAQVIERHSQRAYRVYMIGFLPGYTYLGGLDPTLATPRLDSPRARTPAGSVSIGGVQAAIGSIEGPSGWHLLGRTPVRTFMPARDPVFFLAPGDDVIFKPVASSQWDALETAAARGALVAERLS